MTTTTRQTDSQTFGTDDGAQLVRGQRHTLVGSDGSTFTGVSIGVSVAKGVLRASFEDVTGDVPTTGSRRRFYDLPLSRLTTPRPRLFFDA